MPIISNELHEHLVSELTAIDSMLSSNPNQALPRVVALVESVRQTQDDRGYVNALLKMAEVYWHTMDYQAGLRVCRRIESLLTPELEFQFLTPLYHRIATLNWGLARYRSAQHFWNQALEKSILHNEFELQLEALIGLGNVWRITGNLVHSASALQFALEMSIQREFKWIAGKASILLAWSLFLQKKYPDMLPLLERCNDLLADCPDQTWHAEIHDFKGLALLYSGDISQAEIEIQHALKIASEHNLAWMSAHASVSSARVAKKQGQLSQANQYLEAAEQLAQGFDQGELLSQICLERTEICQRLGQDDQALMHYRDYRRYELNLIREQSLSKGSDEFLSSRGQLDLRSKQLIKRMNVGDSVNQIQHYPHMRDRGAWLFSCRMRLDEPSSAVYKIDFASSAQCEYALPLLHSVLREGDKGVVWHAKTIALLMACPVANREKLRQHLMQMLAAFPWWHLSDEALPASVTLLEVNEFLKQAEADVTQKEPQWLTT